SFMAVYLFFKIKSIILWGMRYIYTLIFYLSLPFILLRLLLRSRSAPCFLKRCWERFGFSPIIPSSVKTIWLHAVSFGEARLATLLVQQLKRIHPELNFIVTTMTLTGAQQVEKTLAKDAIHTYVPYDIPDAIKRFLARTKPLLLIILETELWPNILHYT